MIQELKNEKMKSISAENELTETAMMKIGTSSILWYNCIHCYEYISHSPYL